jgi:hypothetical protein
MPSRAKLRKKVPKKVGGFKIPKPLRKQANQVIGRLQGEELQALLGSLLAAAVMHYAQRGKAQADATPLSHKLAGAVQSHLRQ